MIARQLFAGNEGQGWYFDEGMFNGHPVFEHPEYALYQVLSQDTDGNDVVADFLTQEDIEDLLADIPPVLDTVDMSPPNLGVHTVKSKIDIQSFCAAGEELEVVENYNLVSPQRDVALRNKNGSIFCISKTLVE